MTSFRCFSCVAFICLTSLVNAAEFSGKVVEVMDGDTLLVIRDRHPVKVRLAEIDAPEKSQPFGSASKKSLVEMVKGKQVRVVSRAVDDYGRKVAVVYVGEDNVNHEQVRRGMAWEYSRYHSNRNLMDLQREAQQARRGLWAETDAVEPSVWRKQHPGTGAAQPGAASSLTPAASAALDQTPSPDSGQACGKKHCSEMASCGEARRNLSLCSQRALDGDADGEPCERLCAGAGEKTGGAQ